MRAHTLIPYSMLFSFRASRVWISIEFNIFCCFQALNGTHNCEFRQFSLNEKAIMEKFHGFLLFHSKSQTHEWSIVGRAQ